MYLPWWWELYSCHKIYTASEKQMLNWKVVKLSWSPNGILGRWQKKFHSFLEKPMQGRPCRNRCHILYQQLWVVWINMTYMSSSCLHAYWHLLYNTTVSHISQLWNVKQSLVTLLVLLRIIHVGNKEHAGFDCLIKHCYLNLICTKINELTLWC